MPSVIGGGYAVAPPPAPPAVLTLLETPNGGAESGIAGPASVSYNGYTYTGFIHSSGAVKVQVTNESTGLAVFTTAAFHTFSTGDVHFSPALLVRSTDHKLLVVYSGHNSSEMWRRISSTSLDTDPDLSDGFTSELALHSQLGSFATYTYPILLQLNSETSDPIWLFWRERHTIDRLRYSKSTDGGTTWISSIGLAVSDTAGQSKTYWNIGTNGTDRFDVMWCDYADGADSEMYHFYYTGGNYRKTDATLIISEAALIASGGTDALNKADMTLVLDNSDGPTERCPGVVTDGSTPAGLGLQRHGSTNRVVSCRYRSGAWQTDVVVEDVGGFLSGNMYQSFAAVKYDDPDIVYVPVVDGSVFEMFRYTTADDGGTWTPEQLTTASAADNFMPRPVWNASADIECIWPYGSFTDDDTFSLGLRGAEA